MKKNELPVWAEVLIIGGLFGGSTGLWALLVRYGWSDFWKNVHEWQTLIAAMIALAAALSTIRVMNGQRADERERHKSLLLRKKLAARAQMPDALSAICRYATDSVDYLLHDQVDLPDSPQDEMTTLKLALEYIDNSEAEITYQIISHYQIQNSRLESFDRELNEYLINQYCYDAILLYALATSLFDYARNKNQDGGAALLTREELDRAANNVFFSLGSERSLYPEEAERSDYPEPTLEEIIQRRHGRN
ncbi:MAG: hypothetical protein AAF739_09345 [Pseudomonadota bacterium]